MGAISIDYGTVQVFDDAAPADIYQEIADAAGMLTYQWGWRSTVAQARYWHHEIMRPRKIKSDDPLEMVRGHPVPGFYRYIQWLLGEVVPAETKLLRFYLNAHTFGTDGSPHTDSEIEGELTLVHFLNSGWRAEYGGETAVFDAAGEEIERAVLPRPNRLVSFPSHRLHAPRPLSKLFPGLRVVMVTKLGVSDKGWVRA
jgi:SM-20-related protein